MLPTYNDIIVAAQRIAPYLPPTPLVHSWKISRLLGCEYHVKCENFQPVGAFKVRGGVHLISQLGETERRRGVISASTGNHGQSLAFAGGLFSVPVTIYAPAQHPNMLKVEQMRALGAEVRLFGRDFDAARLEVERVGREDGVRYVHSANEPDLIAGVGTMGLEINTDLPSVEVVFVPIGGGSGAAGIALALKQHRPQVKIIGVQAAKAPACQWAWEQRHLEVKAPMETVHEGLATRVPFEMTMRLLWDNLDDFVLVEDEEINQAIRYLAAELKVIAEGAGAASLAAAIKLKKRLKEKQVVGILSGGNLPPEHFLRILGPS